MEKRNFMTNNRTIISWILSVLKEKYHAHFIEDEVRSISSFDYKHTIEYGRYETRSGMRIVLETEMLELVTTIEDLWFTVDVLGQYVEVCLGYHYNGTGGHDSKFFEFSELAEKPQ